MLHAAALLVAGFLTSAGVPPPTALRVQPLQASTGDLGLLYTLNLSCAGLCIFPKQVEIERNGETLATAAIELYPSRDQADYAIFINAKNWKAGDCFRLRMIAPARDGLADHADYSAYSNKLCLPTT
jgi:hypothetical protein